VVVAAGVRCPAAPRAGADSLRCSSRAATRPRCTARPIPSALAALVLGTDFPYETGAVFERVVSYITTSGLAPGGADRVLSVNAEALFSWRDR